MASLHHHYFIAHPTEQKDGNESSIETLSFFFPTRVNKQMEMKVAQKLLPTRTNKCLQASYGHLLETLSTPP
jgi:hypothetical protein